LNLEKNEIEELLINEKKRNKISFFHEIRNEKKFLFFSN